MLGDDEGMSGCPHNPNKVQGEFSSVPPFRFPPSRPPSAPLLRQFYLNWAEENQVFLLIIAQKVAGKVPVSAAATGAQPKPTHAGEKCYKRLTSRVSISAQT